MKRVIALMFVVFLFALPGVPAHGGAAHGGTHGAGQHTGELLDLNAASVDELKQLPGIGEAQAKKIVESRPFKRNDELITKKILSVAAYDKIKEHLAAKPGAAPGK
jgi:DNA uptake protein ComE-like DNA-binding protein